MLTLGNSCGLFITILMKNLYHHYYLKASQQINKNSNMLTSGRGLSQFLNLVSFDLTIDYLLHDPEHPDERKVVD